MLKGGERTYVVFNSDDVSVYIVGQGYYLGRVVAVNPLDTVYSSATDFLENNIPVETVKLDNGRFVYGADYTFVPSSRFPRWVGNRKVEKAEISGVNSF
jgi:hypothetical protein